MSVAEAPEEPTERRLRHKRFKANALVIGANPFYEFTGNSELAKISSSRRSGGHPHALRAAYHRQHDRRAH